MISDSAFDAMLEAWSDGIPKQYRHADRDRVSQTKPAPPIITTQPPPQRRSLAALSVRKRVTAQHLQEKAVRCVRREPPPPPPPKSPRRKRKSPESSKSPSVKRHPNDVVSDRVRKRILAEIYGD